MTTTDEPLKRRRSSSSFGYGLAGTRGAPEIYCDRTRVTARRILK